jgi:hypothetical protein
VRGDALRPISHHLKGADFIVAGNKCHFPPRSCGTIRIVNAPELLDRITPEM